MNPEICAYFGYDSNVVNDYLNNKENEKELDFVNNCENKRYIHKMTETDKSLFDLGYIFLREKRKDLNIDYDSYSRNKIKIDGQERKLFRYLKDELLSEKIGRYKLPNKELYFVISTNPDDFVLCSTRNSSWTSCTDLEKGDFKFTTIGNVFTRGRFIMYITDMKEKSFLDASSYEMLFRAFGFVGSDGKLYGNIWYPMRENMDLYVDDIHINCVNETVTNKYPIDKVYNKFENFTAPYLDYGDLLINGSDLGYNIRKEYNHFYPLTFFKNSDKYIKTSEHYWYDGTDIEKAMKRRCDCCGSKTGKITTYGNENYCSECLKNVKKTCKVCGEEKTNCHFTEDNKWICDKCLKENDIKLCKNCGTTIKMKNKTECKYCRSIQEDAFMNIQYEYYDRKANNVRDYFRHIYIKDDMVPPGLIEDEEFFEEHEIYLKR